jgi:hypothetical protein
VAGGEATTREPQQKGAPLGNQANLRGIGPRGARFGGGGGGAVGVVPGWRRWRVWAGEVALETWSSREEEGEGRDGTDRWRSGLAVAKAEEGSAFGWVRPGQAVSDFFSL